MGAVEASLCRVRGLICWSAQCDTGLGFGLKFGRPSIQIVRGPRQAKSRSLAEKVVAARRLLKLRGECELWIYSGYWTVKWMRMTLASTSASLRQRRMAASVLEGQRLVAVRIDARSAATTFAFDLGTTLEVRRGRRGSKDRLWILRKQTGYVLSVFGNGTYAHEPASGMDCRPGVRNGAIVGPHGIVSVGDRGALPGVAKMEFRGY